MYVLPLVIGQQCHYVGMKLSDYVAAASISCFIQAHCFCGAAGSFHHNYLMLNTDKYNPCGPFVVQKTCCCPLSGVSTEYVLNAFFSPRKLANAVSVQCF